MLMSNPILPLSSNAKIALGVAAGTVVFTATLATVLWAAKSDPAPPKKALEIGPGCMTYAILSQQQLRDDLRIRVRAAAREGPIDPLTVTARYIRSQAPRCLTYPGNTETPSQVHLFAEIYTQLLSIMFDDDFMSGQDVAVWQGMMITWAAGQGVPAEDL